MFSIKGYFNGKVFVPLDKVEINPNQKVIITVLDEYMDIHDNCVSDDFKIKLDAISKLNGLLADEDTKTIFEFDKAISRGKNI